MELGDDKIKHLYKYRKVNDYTKKILIDHSLHFSFTQDFNDPFDGRVLISTAGTHSDIENWLKRIPMPETQRKQMLYQFINGIIDLQSIATEMMKEKDNAMLVLCLSQKYDNKLMWSHYSDCHRGVCLGFKSEIYQNSLCVKFDDPVLLNMKGAYFGGYLPFMKVDYNDNMPFPYNLLKGNKDDLIPFILRKSKDWYYEEERRTFLFNSLIRKQDISFPLNTLSEVYFGCDIDKKDKEELLEIVQKNYLDKGINVDLYQMILSDTTYSLERKKI